MNDEPHSSTLPVPSDEPRAFTTVPPRGAHGKQHGPLRQRPRLALMLILIAAAMPIRFSDSFPLINSVSALDVLLVAAGVTLFLDLAFRPLDVGYPKLFRILCIPLALSFLSIVWSQDRSASLRASLIYLEGVIAYLFVIRELEGLPPERIAGYFKRYAYLVILPAVLLLLKVPGFEPAQPGLSHTSGAYISYYTRLSHPILGRSNNLATILALLVPVLLYWGYSRHDRRITRAGFVALLAIFLTLSRGTLLAFVIGGFLYAPLAVSRSKLERRKSKGRIATTVAVGVILGVVAVGVLYEVNPSTHEFFSGRLSAANVSARSEIISVSISKIAERPLLGFGAGVVPNRDPRLGGGAHNTYLQQLLYFGIVPGFIVCFALLGVASFFLARRPWSGLAGAIGYTLIVELVIFLFESSFEGTVLRVLFYLLVGLATAMLRAVEAGSPQAAGAIS